MHVIRVPEKKKKENRTGKRKQGIQPEKCPKLGEIYIFTYLSNHGSE